MRANGLGWRLALVAMAAAFVTSLVALSAGLAVGTQTGQAVTGTRPLRMVCIGNALGFYEQALKGDITFDEMLQKIESETNLAIQDGIDRIG